MSSEHPALGLDEQDQSRGEVQDDQYEAENFGTEHGEHTDYPPMPDQQQQYGYYDDDADRRAHAPAHQDIPDASAYGKIFVGGISWQTNEANLRSHFEKFGELDDVALMTDKRTGQPRGFGFVTFKDPAVVDVALQQEHVIDGRTVDVKRAVPKDEAPAPTRLESKKIFVGGLAPTVTETEFREYFEAYGPVKEAIVMFDRQTNRSRGFGFITFEHEESVNKVMKDKQHEIMGKFVEVKRAEPRDARGSSSSGGGRDNDDMYGGGMGMYGGRFPGMYGGPMRYPYGYGGRGGGAPGQYPGFSGMGYYGGFPNAYGMGAGGYGGGRGMYGYGGRGSGSSMGPGGSGAPPRDGSPERSTGSSGSASRDPRDDRGGRNSQPRNNSGSGPSSSGQQPQGGYRGMVGMMPMGYGYGYGGAYGMYGGPRPSQDQAFNESGYGGYRGQGAVQNRAERSFRPY